MFMKALMHRQERPVISQSHHLSTLGKRCDRAWRHGFYGPVKSERFQRDLEEARCKLDKNHQTRHTEHVMNLWVSDESMSQVRTLITAPFLHHHMLGQEQLTSNTANEQMFEIVSFLILDKLFY